MNNCYQLSVWLYYIPYIRIVQNFGEVKLKRIDCFRVFGEENVGEFAVANISEIWNLAE